MQKKPVVIVAFFTFCLLAQNALLRVQQRSELAECRATVGSLRQELLLRPVSGPVPAPVVPEAGCTSLREELRKTMAWANRLEAQRHAQFIELRTVVQERAALLAQRDTLLAQQHRHDHEDHRKESPRPPTQHVAPSIPWPRP